MQTCHGDLRAAAADAASAGYASEATFLQQLVWATGSQEGSQAEAACSQQGSQVKRPARSHLMYMRYMRTQDGCTCSPGADPDSGLLPAWLLSRRFGGMQDHSRFGCWGALAAGLLILRQEIATLAASCLLRQAHMPQGLCPIPRCLPGQGPVTRLQSQEHRQRSGHRGANEDSANLEQSPASEAVASSGNTEMHMALHQLAASNWDAPR